MNQEQQVLELKAIIEADNQRFQWLSENMVDISHLVDEDELIPGKLVKCGYVLCLTKSEGGSVLRKLSYADTLREAIDKSLHGEFDEVEVV